MRQPHNVSDSSRAPGAALATRQVKARLVGAGLVYHRRDGSHRTITRGLKVRYWDRHRSAVVVTYALSPTDLQGQGDEQLVVEIRQVLSKAKEVLERAGLYTAFLGTTMMALVAMPEHVIRYHVFSSDASGTPYDTWYGEHDLREAKRLFGWYARSYGHARLYQEVYPNQDAYEGELSCEEECLLRFGPHPL